MVRWAYPQWAFFRAHCHHPGQLLWNPLRNMGEPYLADPQSMAANPLLWILSYSEHFLDFLRRWIAFHTAVAVLFSGLLAYRWYRNTWSAVTAGLLFGFNGFLTARATMPNHLAAAAYLPVILFFLDRGAAVGFGGAVALQWLTGSPSFSYLSVLMALFFSLQHKKSVRCFALGSALAGGLTAIQWLPFAEMLRLSKRSLFLNADVATEFSISSKLLLKELFLPQWTRFISSMNGDFAVACFYMGLIAVALAFWGALRGTRREKYLAGGVGVSLLLSLGTYLPGYRQIFFLHLFRFPALWLLVATFGMSFLAAAGMAHVKRPAWRWALFILMATDLLLFNRVPRCAWFPPTYLEQKPQLVDTVETTAFSRIYHASELVTLWDQQPLRTEEDYLLMKDLLLPSYGMAFGIPEAYSYQVLRSKRAQVFLARLERAGPRSPLWKEAGISTLVRLAPGTRQMDRAHVQIWPYRHPAPPIYLEEGAPGTVLLQRMTPGDVSAVAELKHPARMVFRDVFYPGWRAFIDGVQTDVEVFDDTFMALQVPAGRHEVTLRYYPASFQWGRTVTLLTLLGLLGGWVRIYKRSER